MSSKWLFVEDDARNWAYLVIDCTEFKCQKASNYDLNSLMFSDYKNATTAKALIGITPHGSGIILSDMYPKYQTTKSL